MLKKEKVYRGKQIRFFGSLFGTFHAHSLYFVSGFTDTGGIDKPQAGGTYHDCFFYGVPGSAGNLCDDDPLETSQGIEQTGFAYIGFAQDGGGHTLAQDPALAVSLQQGVERFGVRPKGGIVILKIEIVDILVGVVQYGVEVAAQVGQIVVNGCQFLLQDAAYLSGSVGGGVGGVCFDQIDDSFCLGQIQLSVKESALCELTALGGLCAGTVQGVQSSGQNGGRTMTMEFYGIFTGVAVRTPGVYGHALVNDPSILVM